MIVSQFPSVVASYIDARHHLQTLSLLFQTRTALLFIWECKNVRIVRNVNRVVA